MFFFRLSSSQGHSYRKKPTCHFLPLNCSKEEQVYPWQNMDKITQTVGRAALGVVWILDTKKLFVVWTSLTY